MEQQEYVVLVNNRDEELGTMEKLEAHQKGVLHRAFSIFILNTANKLLLQQRAHSKYHTPGLWTNACCSHPRPGENTHEAARRRLREELGFTCDLAPLFTFQYEAEVGNGLIEKEYDHLFIGRYDGIIYPNDSEVAACQFIAFDALETWMAREPEAFTPWFKVAWPTFRERATT